MCFCFCILSIWTFCVFPFLKIAVIHQPPKPTLSRCPRHCGQWNQYSEFSRGFSIYWYMLSNCHICYSFILCNWCTQKLCTNTIHTEIPFGEFVIKSTVDNSQFERYYKTTIRTQKKSLYTIWKYENSS